MFFFFNRRFVQKREECSYRRSTFAFISVSVVDTGPWWIDDAGLFFSFRSLFSSSPQLWLENRNSCLFLSSVWCVFPSLSLSLSLSLTLHFLACSSHSVFFPYLVSLFFINGLRRITRCYYPRLGLFTFATERRSIHTMRRKKKFLTELYRTLPALQSHYAHVQLKIRIKRRWFMYWNIIFLSNSHLEMFYF